MLCQFWFYVFCTVCTVCTVCWSIWNQSHPAAETITFCVVPYGCVTERKCPMPIANKHSHQKRPPRCVFVRSPSLHRVYLPSLFGGTSVHPLSLVCVCICVTLGKFVFPKPLRQSASHFLEDDFPGFLPPVIPSVCPTSCREPRLPLSSFLLYSWNCRIRMRIAKYIGLKCGEIDEKEGKIRLPWPRVVHFRMQSGFIASDNQSFVLS